MTPGARPFGAVVSELAGNIRAIVRGELRLAYAELTNNGIAVRRAAIWLGIGVILAFLGLGCLWLAAIFAIALALPLWAAAVVVGGTSLLMAGLAAVIATKHAKSARGLPRTLATIEETTRWPMSTS